MSVYVKNNRNELLTQSKKLFVNSPNFVDGSGDVIIGTVDGSAYTPGVDILTEGQHTFYDGVTSYIFIVYTNYIYWGKYYAKQIISDNIPEISSQNIFLYPTINQPIKIFPAVWILFNNISDNLLQQSGSSSDIFSRTYNYSINIMIPAIHFEKSTEDMEYIIERILTLFNSSDNKQLGCFADDSMISTFSFTSIENENIQLDNEKTAYFQASADFSIKKGNIFISRS